MENNVNYNDGRLALGIEDGSAFEDIKAAVPTLNSNNLRHIAKIYSRYRRLPTFEELRLYGAILERRRTCAEGILVSSPDTDSIAVGETYKDMMEKARTLVGRKVDSLTLEESAAVLGEYMRMIGRYDCRSFVTGIEREGLSIDCEGESLMVLGGKKRKKRRPSSPLNKEGYALMLVNNVPAARSFLSEKSVRAMYERLVRVGDMGLIGLLSRECRGCVVDNYALSEELPLHTLMTDSFIGDYVVIVEHTNAKKLLALAKDRGIDVRHFANTEKKPFIRGRHPRVPVGLVRELMESRRAVRPTVSDTLAPYESLPVSAVDGERARDITDTLLMSRGRLVSAICIVPEDNAFTGTVNALVDGILRLTAAGVDRCAISISSVYEFPKNDTSAEALGRNIGAILGVYRVGVELALMDGHTEVRYTDRRRLGCALYASASRTDMRSRFVSEDSYVGFLPLESRGDGLVDMASLRRVCDEFIKLVRRGAVLSARAVTKAPIETIGDMEGDMVAELSENGRIIAKTPCKGILFESSINLKNNAIGRLKRTVK